MAFICWNSWPLWIFITDGLLRSSPDTLKHSKKTYIYWEKRIEKGKKGISTETTYIHFQEITLLILSRLFLCRVLSNSPEINFLHQLYGFFKKTNKQFICQHNSIIHSLYYLTGTILTSEAQNNGILGHQSHFKIMCSWLYKLCSEKKFWVFLSVIPSTHR